MKFTAKTVILSLDGWTLTSTCAKCGRLTTNPVNKLYQSADRGRLTELASFLAGQLHCGVPPSRATVRCTWALRYQTDVPVVDLTALIGTLPSQQPARTQRVKKPAQEGMGLLF